MQPQGKQPQGKPSQEAFAEMGFPMAGIDVTRAFFDQRPRQLTQGGEYRRTCREGVNVRGFEAGTQHGRGGSRAGLVKYVAAAVVAGWVVQLVDVVAWTEAGAVS